MHINCPNASDRNVYKTKTYSKLFFQSNFSCPKFFGRLYQKYECCPNHFGHEKFDLNKFRTRILVEIISDERPRDQFKRSKNENLS